MNKIKAIGFDYGGVIQGTPSPQVIHKICEHLNVSVKAYLEAYLSHNRQYNLSQIDRKELYRLTLRDLGKEAYLDSIYNLNEHMFVKPVNLPLINLIAKLRANGYKCGILSNNNRRTGHHMRQQLGANNFDAFLVSTDIGYVKPDVEAFQLLAQELQVNLDEMIFVDDSPKSLSSASKAGYYPILYTNFGHLLHSLNELNININ